MNESDCAHRVLMPKWGTRMDFLDGSAVRAATCARCGETLTTRRDKDSSVWRVQDE